MRTGVYAGSFCPVTKGHIDAIEKAARLVDKLYVVVGVNINNAQAVVFDGMMTDFCKRVDADVMIKSIRNAVDLQSVIDLSDINDSYWEGETVFVVGSKDYRHISSSLVRELASLKQDFSEFVPDCCYDEIKKYLVK